VACERAIFDWGRESLALWPNLLEQLQVDSGAAVFFQQRGSVVVAHSQDRTHLQQFNQRLAHCAPDHMAQVQCLDRIGLQELEADLALHFNEATFLAEEGTLDNRELLAALKQAIRKTGAEWWEGVDVSRVDNCALYYDDKVFLCDLAIDTRGFGAKKQLADLRGVRGEVLWVCAPEVKLSRPVRLMHPRYQLYIAPKRDSVYVIGATEIESEALTPITVRSSLELQSALYSVHTGFAEAQILHAYANCRPAFSDNLPRIDCSSNESGAPGLIRVNGLYRHGYLLGPLVLNLALAAIEGPVAHAIVRSIDKPAAENLQLVNAR
jgi:glycine oxidase